MPDNILSLPLVSQFRIGVGKRIFEGINEGRGKEMPPIVIEESWGAEKLKPEMLENLTGAQLLFTSVVLRELGKFKMPMMDEKMLGCLKKMADQAVTKTSWLELFKIYEDMLGWTMEDAVDFNNRKGEIEVLMRSEGLLQEMPKNAQP